MPRSPASIFSVNKIVSALKSVVHRVLWMVFSLIRTVTTGLDTRNEDIWLFGAHHGGQFTENTKYLFLHVSNEHSDEVRPIWLSRNDRVVSELQSAGYEAYNYRRPGALLLKLRAKVVVVSHLLDDIGWWPLVGGAKIVNTLHGVATIKDMTREISRRPRDLLGNDYLVSTSEFHDLLLSKRTWTRDEDTSLITGYPRDDAILRDIEGAHLMNGGYHGHIEQLADDNVVISYHPTHRDTIQNPLFEHGNLEAMNAFLGERDAVLLIKPHPSRELQTNPESYDNIESIPPSLDIYPVMDSIDILVTDYSSIYYDFLLTGRRPVLFPYDMEEYREAVGIHPDVDYQSLGETAQTLDELKSILDENIRSEPAPLTEQQAEMRDRAFAYVDSHSSERLYKAIQTALLEGTPTKVGPES